MKNKKPYNDKGLLPQWDPVALLLLKLNCFFRSQSLVIVDLNLDISGNAAINPQMSEPQDFFLSRMWACVIDTQWENIKK